MPKELPCDPEINAVSIDPLYSGCVTDTSTDLAFDLFSKFGLITIPVDKLVLAGEKSFNVLNN